MLNETTVQYLLHWFRICLFMFFFSLLPKQYRLCFVSFQLFFSFNHASISTMPIFANFPSITNTVRKSFFFFYYHYCMTRSAGSRWRRELRNVSSIPRDWKPRACVLLAFCLVFTTTLLVQVTHWRLPARARRLNCFVCLWWRAWNSCEPYWEWDK